MNKIIGILMTEERIKNSLGSYKFYLRCLNYFVESPCIMISLVKPTRWPS